MSRTQAKGKFVKVNGKRIRQDGLVRHDEMLKWIRERGVALRGGDVDEAPVELLVHRGRCEELVERHHDVVLEPAPDLRILVQEDGLPMIAGAILDYEDSHRGRGFRLANPAAKSACGCGQAFYADFSDQEPAAAAEMAD